MSISGPYLHQLQMLKQQLPTLLILVVCLMGMALTFAKRREAPKAMWLGFAGFLLELCQLLLTAAIRSGIPFLFRETSAMRVAFLSVQVLSIFLTLVVLTLLFLAVFAERKPQREKIAEAAPPPLQRSP